MFRFSKAASLISHIIANDSIPIIPKKLAANMKIKRHALIPFIKSISVNIRLHIEVNATTITVIGETIPASTAAWPSTKAPTILMAADMLFGLLMSLSLSISNIVVSNIISNVVGKGTPSLCMARDINNLSGIVFWSYVVMAIYIAGVNSVIIKAISLKTLVNVMLVDF